jgi:hypothetical protein
MNHQEQETRYPHFKKFKAWNLKKLVAQLDIHFANPSPMFMACANLGGVALPSSPSV